MQRVSPKRKKCSPALKSRKEVVDAVDVEVRVDFVLLTEEFLLRRYAAANIRSAKRGKGVQ